VVNVGVDSAAQILNGGVQIVHAGTSATNAVIAAGGVQLIQGSASGTVNSGGFDAVGAGARVTSEIVSAGGLEVVSNTAITTGTVVVGANAQQVIFSGGVASNTSVGSGAFLFLSQGTTSNAVVSGSGTETVFSGGIASDTTVLSGGTLEQDGGGTLAGVTTISSGGAFAVGSGFAVTSYVVSGGTILKVLSSGTLNGATISSGSIEIQVGALVGASTINISSGTLILDDSQHFSGLIAGLLTSGVQNVDLVDINFATLTLGYSGNTSSGVLSASDTAGHTALLNMIGNYTLGSFNTKAANDGHGGTLITDPPVSSSSNIVGSH
jgi:autotransporter passenger strand-loop-strand repeat protein